MPSDPYDPDATLRALAPEQRVLNQRYTLVKILGRGGMGVVWQARDESLNHDVALKFLPEAVIHDSAAIHDLKQETQRSLKLTHPNIVRIHGFIEDGERTAISMEYVDGATLAKLRVDQPATVFTTAAVLPYITQIVEALDYAHNRAKVVHRDLKPANLLISKDGEVKIADFGISATLSDTATRLSKRENGSSGSPPYMSPQQMMGEKPCIADDVYALGATIYELLTSKPPFYTGNLLAQVQGKVAPPMTQRRAELLGDVAKPLTPIAPEWESIVEACLAKDPQDRPVSVRAVLAAINGNATAPKPSAKGKIVVTPPQPPASDSGPSRTEPKKRRNLVPWMLAGLFLAALAWGAFTYGPTYFGPKTTFEILARPGTQVAAKDAAGKVTDLGIISGTGNLQVNNRLSPGKYYISLTHPDCEPSGLENVMLDETAPKSIHGTQKPKPATLELITIPPGAEIWIDDKPAGNSPLSIPNLASETELTYEAALAGSRRQTGKITLKPRENKTITLPEFVPDNCTVRLQIQPLDAKDEHLKAEVDGHPVSIEAGEIHDLVAGKHAVKLSHPDFQTWTGSVVVDAKAAVDLQVAFTEKPGSLDIATTPSGAKVTVKPVGHQASAAPLQIEDKIAPARLSLPSGDYLVSCTLPGFTPAERRISVPANKTESLAITLEALRGPAPGQSWTIAEAGLTLLPVAAGEFNLGSGPEEAGRDPSEGPARRVSFQLPYWIGQYEVTRGNWNRVMEGKPEQNGANLPKTEVNYTEVMSFLERLNQTEAKAGRLPKEYRYTLPTEAEWEYACKAGTTGPFSCGNSLNSTQANFDGAFPYGGAAAGRSPAGPVPVGSFSANPWGIYDMHGNVSEWCLDLYALNAGQDPEPDGVKSSRVVRGGAWNSPAHRCRSATRLAVAESTRSPQLGFRVALTPVPAADQSSAAGAAPATIRP
jgi:serine/threonine protein kinase/formylglycine-generating enzyme required for sulfatase activity